jgi:hypothetical protein
LLTTFRRLPLSRQRDTIADGYQTDIHPGIPVHMLVEFADGHGFRFLIVVIILLFLNAPMAAFAESKFLFLG